MPLPLLARLARPSAPEAVLSAAQALEYRAMLLIYLVLETERFTEFDAHYFPESEVAITRLSEPKHYGLAQLPGTTVLCGELPCSQQDAVWSASDEALKELVVAALARAGLKVEAPIRRVLTRRLPQAYPIYRRDYRSHFQQLEQWVGGLAGLVTLGRQGLFVHDNTHHTLAMSYAACECISDSGELDRSRWSGHLRQFEAHVVED
jgi:protoporphyrinogen oxidase